LRYEAIWIAYKEARQHQDTWDSIPWLDFTPCAQKGTKKTYEIFYCF
jgi:hypothetical protein